MRDKAEFLESVKDIVRANLLRDGHLMPVILCVNDTDQMTIIPLDMADEDAKDRVSMVLQHMRMTYRMVVMVSESWLVEGHNLTKEDMAVPPSRNPNRKEVAMLAYHDEDGQEMWFADIVRANEALSLGAWRTIDGSLKGRFVEPPPSMTN